MFGNKAILDFHERNEAKQLADKWRRAAKLYFHIAEWFAQNEPGTPVPEWCELAWPIQHDEVREQIKLYKEQMERKIE